jgi:hypothetical protein
MERKVISNEKGVFECPLCHSEAYVYVLAHRPDGSDRVTSLMQCLGCTVTFTDPVKFSRPRKMLLVRNLCMGDFWYIQPEDGGPSYASEGLPLHNYPRKPRGTRDER